MQMVIAADGAMTYRFLVTKVAFYFFKFSAIENLGKKTNGSYGDMSR